MDVAPLLPAIEDSALGAPPPTRNVHECSGWVARLQFFFGIDLKRTLGSASYPAHMRAEYDHLKCHLRQSNRLQPTPLTRCCKHSLLLIERFELRLKSANAIAARDHQR